MSMPNHLVLVRHGESEGNYFRNQFKAEGQEPSAELTYQFKERTGTDWRLTPEGVKQAQIAGVWIQENIIKKYGLPGFGRYFFSTHRRTIETAGHLALPEAQWRPKRELRERSWGELENITGEREHKRLYPANYHWMLRDPLGWRPVGGESVEQVAETRWRSILDTLHRDHDEKGVDSAICSTHGETILAALLTHGYMLNHDWLDFKNNPENKIHNCEVVHLSRQNPEDQADQADYLKWMRMVCPWKDDTDSGWSELSRPIFSNDELITIAETLPRIAE
jgi:broad specificity phosphatase PhoE